MRFTSSPVGCLLFAFSAISLFLLPTWLSIYETRGAPYDDKFVANHHEILDAAKLDYAGGILATTLLTLALALVLAVVVKRSNTGGTALASLIGAGLILLALNTVRASYLHWASLGNIRAQFDASPVATAGVLIVVTVAIVAVVIRCWRLLPHLVLIGLPIGLVLLANGTGAVARIGPPALTPTPRVLAPAQDAPKAAARRVVWLIFDEFDYRLGFEKRPDDVPLETLDALRKSSFFATAAVSPAAATTISVPSLLIGETVAKTDVLNDGFQVRIDASKPGRAWSEMSNIFESQHRAGRRVGAFGQDFIPYCRTFADRMRRCWEMSRDWERPSGVVDQSQQFLRRAISFVPVVNRWLVPEFFDPGLRYEAFADTIDRAAGDTDLDFVYAHWMVPHTPYVFDRHTRQYVGAVNEDSHDRYFSNMVLADILIKRTLAALRAEGSARDWALIISSDHHWRRAAEHYDGVSDPRVPFIVHFPDDPEGGLIHDRALPTVLTRDLAEAILDGEVQDHRGVAMFIERWQKGRALATKQ